MSVERSRNAETRADLESRLRGFLPEWAAEEAAAVICAIVAEVDREIDRILADPLVSEFWDYDGRCFVARDGRFGLQVAFDGAHIFEWLHEYLDYFFSPPVQPNAGVEMVIAEMETFLWLAKVRRMNWEEEGRLSLISEEALKSAINEVRERRPDSVLPLSDGERAFFRRYEEEFRSGRYATATASD